MTNDLNEHDRDDSPAIDGMLRQVAHEESGSGSDLVSRIMNAVQDAEEEMRPKLIVIPTRYFAVAASVVLALGIAIWLATRPGVCGVVTSDPIYVVDGNRLEKRMPGEGLFEGETIRGRGIETFKLVDGSMVTIDNGSLLTLKKPSDGERINLSLIKGKLFLRVTKEKGRFLIDAGVPVEVLGTTFGVRRENQETVVAVYEGRVQMGGEMGLIIKRGMSAHTEHGSQHPVDYPVPPNNELSWARPDAGLLNVPLSTALAWITENSSYSFDVKDASLNNRVVSFGYQRGGDIDTAVKHFLDNEGLSTHNGFSFSKEDESL